ncbi:DNA repair protein RecO [Glaciecola siphonariae]|uniref:DNA repair protein RecO n=1 Tax=Glaciecola siphonariae TaxID=521012 RepID=A0ABV9LYN6_9ALTE
MSRLQASGYVIHRRPYRETSMLVDFFTRQYGRISAVVKGARGAGKSDRKSLIQPLQLLSFELSGRSQLKNLGLAEALHSPLKLDGNCLYSAFYLNELLIRAVPETEPMSLLFEQYQQSLLHLQSASTQADISNTNNGPDVEPILRDFELMLLQELGYLPDFEYSADTGEAIHPEGHYTFIAEQGFVACPAQQPFALLGQDLIAIAHKRYESGARKAAKYICRQALLPIIGDKPLKSRELFIKR